MTEFARDESVSGDRERLNRPPATLFLKDGRIVELPDVSPNVAVSLCTTAAELGEKFSEEIDPADIESIGYTDEEDPAA